MAFDVAPGSAAAALAAMRTLGIGGLSVTTPHKEDVAAAVDVLAPAAAALRSVNTVVCVDGGRLVGHSTDGDGFVASLAASGVERRRRVASPWSAPAPRRAASSTPSAGRGRPTSPSSTARSTRAAEAAALAPSARVGSAADIAGADIVVNATSVGMGTAELPFDPALLRPGQVVADLVYHPLRHGAAGGRRGRRVARPSTASGCSSTKPSSSSSCGPACRPDPATMRAAADAELARRA